VDGEGQRVESIIAETRADENDRNDKNNRHGENYFEVRTVVQMWQI
jgi:hypothetical protein